MRETTVTTKPIPKNTNLNSKNYSSASVIRGNLFAFPMTKQNMYTCCFLGYKRPVSALSSKGCRQGQTFGSVCVLYRPYVYIFCLTTGNAKDSRTLLMQNILLLYIPLFSDIDYVVNPVSVFRLHEISTQIDR